MKVVLLAGGFGTRISEESAFKPKPMIEIGGMPILWHIMKEYAYYGHNEFIICAGYRQEYIKKCFADYFLCNSDVTFDFRNDKNEMTIHESPWQHVLESLSGYMLLASKMLHEPTKYCEGWNFGPRTESITPVWDVASMLTKYYGRGELMDVSDPNALHEANLLMLDISKAKFQLGWEPRTNIDQCCQLTADRYKRYQKEGVYDLCVEQINTFIS